MMGKSMATVTRLVLKNFRRFKSLELEFDPEMNILVGGNEAGKSTVIQALDLVLSASRSKVEGNPPKNYRLRRIQSLNFFKIRRASQAAIINCGTNSGQKYTVIAMT
jgi:recombinational DNA repair ATPase RecF